MERSKDLSGSGAQAPGTQFTFKDPATGHQRLVWEMTDEEIARHIVGATQELPSVQQNLMKAAAEMSSVNAFIAIFRYEAERRRAKELLLTPAAR